MADLPKLQGEHALDFFNKTVPLYIMRGDRQKQGPWSGLLSAVLHNYLYMKWFRPYRTDIERRQFIAKIVNCKDEPVSNDDATAVDVAMAIRSTIQTRLLNLPPKQFYTISALFKALVIIIPSQSYSICSSIANISAMTVLVLLTGEDDGLSSTITFDSIEDHVERVTFRGMSGIRTKLEIAEDFIMSLEKREVAAFGPQPDPVSSTARDSSDIYASSDNHMYEYEERIAMRLGWRYGAIVGPSSKWVSAARYPEWTGWGANADARLATREGMFWRNHMRACTCYKSQDTSDEIV
ncbi:hypothetical protein NW752_004221 [Fusarium irregulare]|uniref:Uncharacterized protein n=1 Tax=Fusarium irregulare TaxID=2494466 RepID=A0A9W8PM78_9HYPO|nr:hypothetical protein NW766_007121 [Fusarium irregulare]KAJ4021214.1 hypothetical protein NW752_004221 [Fusarium irregulare]